MNLTDDIQKHITLVEDSLAWAEKYGKDTFPVEDFKDYRRQLRKIGRALTDNCSAAAYGESQVGKSYLMSSLLSSAEHPFVIKNGGREYSFVDEINPSGGASAKVESTGVITRFTMRREGNYREGYVKVRNLSAVDIVQMIADSYYNNVLIDLDKALSSQKINEEVNNMSNLWADKSHVNGIIDEDDIKDIADYVRKIIGNNASAVHNSDFFKKVAPNIKYVPVDRWVDVFGLLWNRNPEINHLFQSIINEYRKLQFQEEVFLPFDAVMRDRGTLLKIDWLDTVCGGKPLELKEGETSVTSVYDKNGNLLADDFDKGYLSALIAELVFVVPEEQATDRQFLRSIDLLDFPGARSAEEYHEEEIHTVLPQVLRRGKVNYLFNSYSRSYRISAVLFCHHNDQKGPATVGETINNWIRDNIGKTPAEREAQLHNTRGIAPLFMVATKFNIDLKHLKTDLPTNTEKLAEHWKRFDTVIPQIIAPAKWFDNWTENPQGVYHPFQNIYPLRDFFWSRDTQVFDGYSDGAVKHPETGVHPIAGYPNYWDNLRESFLNNKFVRKHFAHPEQTWDGVATINHDGSKSIIDNLNKIADVLDNARRQNYLTKLRRMQTKMLNTLSARYEPDDSEAKNEKVHKVVGDIQRSLIFSVGKDPAVFGHIIDNMMVPVGDLRAIAYDIIICKTDTPRDFSKVNLLRQLADIQVGEDRQTSIDKLCMTLFCDPGELPEVMKEQGCELEDVISGEAETMTTVADVVTKHIIEYWNRFLNARVKVLQPLMPHSDEVVFMLCSLLKKLNLKKEMSSKIDSYCRIFNTNEQPNVIADYASLTLNNFVSSVGRKYIGEQKDTESLQTEADKCHLKVDLRSEAWNVVRKPQPLLSTLSAFEHATAIL